jgi:hypothetical protein
MFNPTLLRKITIMNTRAALATLNYMREKFSLRMRLEEGLKALSPELVQTSSIRQQQSSAMSLEVLNMGLDSTTSKVPARLQPELTGPEQFDFFSHLFLEMKKRYFETRGRWSRFNVLVKPMTVEFIQVCEASSIWGPEVIADDPLAVQILELQELVHIRA